MNTRKMMLCAWLGLCLPVCVWALHYGVPCAVPGDNLGGVAVADGDTPFPAGALFPISGELRAMPALFLKVVDGVVVLKTDAERSFAALPIQYKKRVDGVWVEMSDAEKHLVDLPSKYKHPDGTEMTAEEKAAVDAAEETARQAAKPLMLKQVENLYVNFLTVEWTGVLRAKELIAADATITVQNTTAVQNITYLMILRAMDRPAYLQYATEFKLFEDTFKERFGAETSDAVWHSDI